MNVSVESPGPILRRMTITVPAGELDQRIETRILRLAKTAKLPGFRPGKIPRKVVESRFSSQVLQEAVEELIDLSYRDALQEKSIVPVGMPSIEAKKMTPRRGSGVCGNGRSVSYNWKAEHPRPEN